MNDNLMCRWSATVTYRTEAGPNKVTHDIEELDDLHELVERGPHFDTVERIVITRHKPMIPDLTVEAAEKL